MFCVKKGDLSGFGVESTRWPGSHRRRGILPDEYGLGGRDPAGIVLTDPFVRLAPKGLLSDTLAFFEWAVKIQLIRIILDEFKGER